MSQVVYDTRACYLEVSKEEMGNLFDLENDIGGLFIHEYGDPERELLEEYIIDLTEVIDWHNGGVEGEPDTLNAALNHIENALDPDGKHNLRQYGIIIAFCEI